ncbi:hypothetical protein G6F50_017086 [Rhizopus delemar]|uniref:Aldehyde dehydrogenase domain-containing protein n=1 Tax=Rhizopus delemar TaxID=936053 RepID=A0A9P6XS08_9FUNG|nr:hypothetical protein G6F50_017086 [Rhizopus delemar]
MPEFMALCVKEAGKSLPDSIAEVREAVDFLRYYAKQAREQFSHAERLPSPTGESNELQLHGRGVFVCISPWNFPLHLTQRASAPALALGKDHDDAIVTAKHGKEDAADAEAPAAE